MSERPDNKDNIVKLVPKLPKAPAKKPEARPRPSKDAYTISTDKLIQLFLQKMEEMHNDVVALGHNDQVMEHYFNMQGEQINLQTEAILRVNDKLAEVMAWIRHTDPTKYNEPGDK